MGLFLYGLTVIAVVLLWAVWVPLIMLALLIAAALDALRLADEWLENKLNELWEGIV